jgi:hypothetical protein
MPPPRRDTNFSTNIKEHSGWWVPLAVAIVVVLFSIFVLLYYLAPNPVSFIEERPSPSARIETVQATVGGLALRIPANYLVFASARKGGTRREIDVAAKLPDFHGYSEAKRNVFSTNGVTSPIVRIKIRGEPFEVPEAARLNRVYLGEVVDPRGQAASYGLTHYEFRDDSGYRGDDLFVGQEENKIVAMLCERPGADVPSPNCLRDYPLGSGAALSYRFKRTHLAQWRDIARGVNRLLSSFENPHG